MKYPTTQHHTHDFILDILISENLYLRHFNKYLSKSKLKIILSKSNKLINYYFIQLTILLIDKNIKNVAENNSVLTLTNQNRLITYSNLTELLNHLPNLLCSFFLNNNNNENKSNSDISALLNRLNKSYC